MVVIADRYALRSDVVATMFEDGAVLLDLETKYFYELNRTGWFIASMFEAGTTESEVIACCREQGAVDGVDIDAVRAAIATLAREGLLAAAEPQGFAEPAPAASPCGWETPTIVKQPEPLQRIIVSAFDPSIPLVE